MKEISANSPATPFRSGYIALVGRPNVGKSTLLNALLGTHLAIVSGKPQTTRDRILGVRTDNDSQMIFLDTPGIHKARESLNRFMVKQALGSMADADVVVVIVPADEDIGGGDRFVFERAKETEAPIIAVLNKIDLVSHEDLARVWDVFAALAEGATDTIAISAKKNAGTENLAELIKSLLPEGPMFFPEDTLTDRGDIFRLAELIREQVFETTRQEIPYASAIRIKRVIERDDGLSEILAVIAVEQDSQKGMMIGKGGEMLKRIGTASRKEMETMLGRKVFLDLHVEVRKDWRKNPKELHKLGYSEEG